MQPAFVLTCERPWAPSQCHPSIARKKRKAEVAECWLDMHGVARDGSQSTGTSVTLVPRCQLPSSCEWDCHHNSDNGEGHLGMKLGLSSLSNLCVCVLWIKTRGPPFCLATAGPASCRQSSRSLLIVSTVGWDGVSPKVPSAQRP